MVATEKTYLNVSDHSTAVDVLIAIEFELAVRCKPGQRMTDRLECVAAKLRSELGMG